MSDPQFPVSGKSVTGHDVTVFMRHPRSGHLFGEIFLRSRQRW